MKVEKDLTMNDVNKGDVLRVMEGYPRFGGCFAVVDSVRWGFDVIRVKITIPGSERRTGGIRCVEIPPQHFEFIAEGKTQRTINEH